MTPQTRRILSIALRTAICVGAMFLVLRAERDPGSLIQPLRSEVLALDADQPIVNVMTMEARLAESIAQERFSTRLLTLFAAFALLLHVPWRRVW